MNKISKIGLFMLLMLLSSTSGLFAQNDTILTTEEIVNIQNSKDYFFGTGWDEIKDKAIDQALFELKRKLKSADVKNYKVAKLDAEGVYFFMIFIEKNASAQPISNEIEQKIIKSVADITTTEMKKEQKPAVSANNAVITNNVEINDLCNTRHYAEFGNKIKQYNRENKMWVSGDKADMTNVNNCYVAIFKDNEMEVFLDKDTGSRKDLLTGKIIQNFETKYFNSNYKIIWIELINNQ